MAKPKLSTVIWALVCVGLVITVLVLSNNLIALNRTLTERDQQIATLSRVKSDLEGELENTRYSFQRKLAAMDEEIRDLTASLNTANATAKRPFFLYCDKCPAFFL